MEIALLHAKNILNKETQMHYNFIGQIESATSIHTHDFYEIFVVVRGSAVHFVNQEKQILTEGSMVLIRPDDIHYYEKYENADCQFINLAFSKEVFQNLISYINNPMFTRRLLAQGSSPVLPLYGEDFEHVRRKLELCSIIPIEDNDKKKAYLKFLVSELLSLYLIHGDHRVKNMPEWLEDLINEIKKKENFILGLSCLHEKANLNTDYLSRAFKKYTGKTPTEYINDLRLNYAANMIAHSDTDITQIIFESGFNNVSHFYHLFRKKYSISPVKFRNQNQRFLNHK
jgi:AraC family cel operon transcriptional repressor